jgi:hypothetical protein
MSADGGGPPVLCRIGGGTGTGTGTALQLRLANRSLARRLWRIISSDALILAPTICLLRRTRLLAIFIITIIRSVSKSSSTALISFAPFVRDRASPRSS